MSRRGTIDAAGAVSATATRLVKGVRGVEALADRGERLAAVARPAPSVCPPTAYETTLSSLVDVAATGRTDAGQPTRRRRPRAVHRDEPDTPGETRHRDRPGPARPTGERDGTSGGPSGRVPSRPDGPDLRARRPRSPGVVPPPEPLSDERLRAATGPMPAELFTSRRATPRPPETPSDRNGDERAATPRPPIVGSPVARAVERVAGRLPGGPDSQLAGLADAPPRPGPAAPARLLDRAVRAARPTPADGPAAPPRPDDETRVGHDRSSLAGHSEVGTSAIATDVNTPGRPTPAAPKRDGSTPVTGDRPSGDGAPVTPSDGLAVQPALVDRPRGSMPWSPEVPTPPGPEAGHVATPVGWPVTQQDLEQRMQQVLDDAARRHGIEV